MPYLVMFGVINFRKTELLIIYVSKDLKELKCLTTTIGGYIGTVNKVNKIINKISVKSVLSVLICDSDIVKKMTQIL